MRFFCIFTEESDKKTKKIYIPKGDFFRNCLAREGRNVYNIDCFILRMQQERMCRTWSILP